MEDEKLKGVAVKIVKMVFKEMKQDISIEVMPWARAILYVKEGKRDVIFTAYKNPVREKFSDYSKEVLIPQVLSFFVRKDASINFQGDFKTLSDYSIGVVRKLSYGRDLDFALSNNIFRKVEAVNNGTQNFKKLLLGRIDMVPDNKYAGLHILNKLEKMDEIRVLPYDIQILPSYIAFSKKSNLIDIRDKFDVILKRLKEDGTYLQILENYSTK